MKALTFDKARTYAYNLLRVRSRSEKELSQKLKEKGYSKPISEKVISFFKELDLINDLKFARAWVDSRLKLNPKGNIVLRQELFDKGVSKNIVDEVLSENENREEEIAKSLAEQRIKRLTGLPRLKVKKRLYDYLARRGFKYDIISEVINQLYAE